MQNDASAREGAAGPSAGQQLRSKERGCAILPAYKEEKNVRKTVEEVLQYVSDVLVVDDGSPDGTAEEARKTEAVVLVHEVNRGKGSALQTGFEYAAEHGYEYVITMDSDGQHAPSDIPVFVEAYVRTGIPVLIGNRMVDTSSMPRLRRWTNRFMSRLLSRRMGQFIADTQNGFRLYHRDVLPFLDVESTGYAAESEVLLRLAERGVRMDSVPVKTIYGDEVSDIHPVRDTMRFFRMLNRRRHRAGRREYE